MFAAFIGIGLVSGFMSGLFGVGGGIMIVPLLVMLAAFGQKLASGTSGASIIVTASVGVIAYAIEGDVDWLAALLLAAGGIVGAPFGAHLLRVLRERIVRWIFIGFLVAVMVSLVFVVPERGVGIDMGFWVGASLVGLGLVTGVLAGLIGVGGGVIVVPVLIVVYGTSDLVAKGTSLMMMIPTTIVAAARNLRNGNVDLLAAMCLALATVVTTPLGALVAAALDPAVANWFFIAFLAVITVQMVVIAVRGRR